MSSSETGGYTLEQIMWGLRAFLYEEFQYDWPIRPTDNICDVFEKCGWIESYLWLGGDIDAFFGVTREGRGWWAKSQMEWTDFYGHYGDEAQWQSEVRPTLTFQRLAEFIQRRTNGRAIEPVRVFGTPCKAAGAFCAIEDVVRDTRPDMSPFPPSARVRRKISGKRLRTTWTRLRWMSEDRLPPLRKTDLDSMDTLRRQTCHLSAVMVFLGVCADALLGTGAGLFLGVVPFLVLILVSGGLALIRPIAVLIDDSLPHGIRDFRDVAKAMVGEPIERRGG